LENIRIYVNIIHEHAPARDACSAATARARLAGTEESSIKATPCEGAALDAHPAMSSTTSTASLPSQLGSLASMDVKRWSIR
jgi:hypothetical protein